MRLAFLIFLIVVFLGAIIAGQYARDVHAREVVPLKRPTTQPKRVVAVVTIQRLMFDDGTDSGDAYSFTANIEINK